MPRSESPVSNAAERPGRVHARCLLFAAATGSLLQIDADEVRLAGWARRGASLPAAPAPSGPEARISALERCGEALEAGFAAASGAGDLAAAEASHYCDTRAQVCALLSEEREAEAERLRASAAHGGAADAAAAEAAAKAAVDASGRALELWERSGSLLLGSPPETEGSLPDDWEEAAWEPEPGQGPPRHPSAGASSEPCLSLP